MLQGDDLLEQLRINLTDESKAYGYTLVIWGSGAVLTNAVGVPLATQIMTYILGALTGFGLLAIPVYGGVFGRIPNVKEEEVIVFSMVHLLAALGTIAIAAGIADMLPPLWAFFMVGLNATVSYNVFLLAEVLIARQLASHRR
ncbi:MAG: hypothetical protein ABEK12_03140 [Candidatus Nanohaloarchaea archaeon]